MIRSMDNAVHAGPQISELVNLWVNGFPASDSLGGFARAVRNSQKAHKLQQKLEELHALDHSSASTLSLKTVKKSFCICL